ncbi:hypothetical protein GCM10027446_23070 [Angustibacter peucedani]
MPAQRTVLVTDVTTPQQFLACLTSVIRSVDPSVAVVAVSTGSGKLPPQVARRVRLVRVPRGGSFSDVVEAEAVRPVTVVVLTSDVTVRGDWLDGLERAVSPTPFCVGLLGTPEPRVLVFGDRVRTTQAQEVVLPDVAGITLPAAAVAPKRSLRTISTVSTVSTVSTASTAASSGRADVDPDRPVTVTAALIVKDEEEVLAACLDAVRPEVDEVVVYDTGSTDGTVELARAHGARVVEGHWDDDFAAARNRLLDHVTTEWVFSLDADEVLQTVPGALRQRLVGERHDLVLVPVLSTSWSAADDGDEHRPVRVFRRERARWEGALHETLVPVDGLDTLVMSAVPAPVRLLHSGYQSDRMATKDKRTRNLAIARTQLDGLDATSSDEDVARARANLGRALVSAGRPDEGLEVLDGMLDLAGNTSEMVLGSRVALITALQLGRLGTYDQWLDVARRYGETEGAQAVARARLLLHHGDLDGALLELEAAATTDGVDPWGVPFDADELVGPRASVLSRQGEHEQALALYTDLLARRQELVPLAALVQTAVNAGQPLGELVAVGGPQFLARSLRDAVQLPPGAADQWLDAAWQADPQGSVLVAGAVVAARLPMEGVLKWSLRVREAGAVELCPLRAIGYDVERPAAERCLALAVLGDVLAERDALVAFDDVAANLPDDQTADLLAALATYAPGLAVEATAPAGAGR